MPPAPEMPDLQKVKTVIAMSENTDNATLLQNAYDEAGRRLSPKLPSHVKNYLIDIDGTICDDVPNEEPDRMATVEHYPDALEILNHWYDEGHQIYFFTSRTDEHRQVTEE